MDTGEREAKAVRDQEKLFCDEYLIDLNAMAAALRAGYRRATAKNASAWIDPEHPTKPGLRAYIDAAMARRARRTGVSADRVVRELAKVAFGDPLRVFDPESGALNDEIDEDDSAMIAGVRVKKGDQFTEREIKLHDKVRALELLGKHLGMFDEAVNVNVAQMPKITVNGDGSADIDREPTGPTSGRTIGFGVDGDRP
jgi:phage terminase small subunit